MRLPRRTVRLRLTAVYVTLFLVSGAGLLTMSYLLVLNQTPAPTMITVNGTAGPSVGALTPAGTGRAPAGGQACQVRTNAAPPTPGQLGDCVSYLEGREAAQRNGFLGTLLIVSGVALAAMASWLSGSAG